MPAPKPQLFTFKYSHYCEKARWALDWHGIAFDEVAWPPGVHVLLARRLGAPRSSLPILAHGDLVLQGSGNIIAWAEQNSANGAPSLVPAADAAQAPAIEHRADAVLGVQGRRLFYAEVLPRYAHVAKSSLFQDTRSWPRYVASLLWPLTRQIMMRTMDARAEAAPDARAKLEAALTWSDDLLADGRRFLVGDRFSRVDLTVASLVAFFAQPQESVYAAMWLPPALAADVARWRARPVAQWVKAMYREYRHRRA